DDQELICNAFVLPGGKVDVWGLSLDRAVQEADWNVLELTERTRADRFRKEIDRDRYVVCRSTLRRILGTYTKCAPDRVEIAYGKHGKPFLPGSDLHFNVSHADGESLIAVTRAGPVGVDLEPETRSLNVGEFAQTVCSRSERVEISALPSADKRIALLRIWVAKEAFLKSIGEGLSRSLSGLDVAELPVQFIDPTPGFVSALALTSLVEN
ncbi:MAG TPA: 4'-phosphopantetheinyl transferase superfamily protein, partial [Chthoniobacterales bacterium]|nr:4'-phosphopantetheinyl transferase superfamily protein [Chthoniobacterales bacterium]